MSLWISGSPDGKRRPLYSITVPFELCFVAWGLLAGLLAAVRWQLAIAAMLFFVAVLAVQVIRAVVRLLQ